MAGRQFVGDVSQIVVEEAVSQTSGNKSSGESSGGLREAMAEGIILAGAWFTARMICQVSYKAIKSYRDKKKRDQDNVNYMPASETACNSPQGPDGGSCQLYRQSGVPWDEGPVNNKESQKDQENRMVEDDNAWIKELKRDSEKRAARDSSRLLHEIRVIGDKIDDAAVEQLYLQLQSATSLLLEYRENPGFRSAMKTLDHAEQSARALNTNEKCLVINLSALRVRIVITYLHCEKHSQGIATTYDDRAADKKQCQLYIRNSLKQASLEELCRRFLASLEMDDDNRRKLEEEVTPSFNLILEVVASVHMLEPFNAEESMLPRGAPEIVLHALAEYCRRNLGDSVIYVDLGQAFMQWQETPERMEKMALHALFKSTNDGAGWKCKQGWGTVFEGDLSLLFGVSTEGGRVTKISLGANNLEGSLPKELAQLKYLTELSLPGNKLSGKVPQEIWSLPALRVVALQGNSISGTPLPRFTAVTHISPPAHGVAALVPAFGRARQYHGLSVTVESCHPTRLEVYTKEWFICSWKITNTGNLDFSSNTRLVKVDDDETQIGGAQVVMLNALMPGEEQTVCVMQQAPDDEGWFDDKWRLAGESIDFADEDAETRSPLIEVVNRKQSGSRRSAQQNRSPSPADTVFVAQAMDRGVSRRSSFFSGAAGHSSGSPPAMSSSR